LGHGRNCAQQLKINKNGKGQTKKREQRGESTKEKGHPDPNQETEPRSGGATSGGATCTAQKKAQHKAPSKKRKEEMKNQENETRVNRTQHDAAAVQTGIAKRALKEGRKGKGGAPKDCGTGKQPDVKQGNRKRNPQVIRINKRRSQRSRRRFD